MFGGSGLTRYPQGRIGATGVVPRCVWGHGICPCGELVISFLILAVERKGRSNGVSGVTVKNTRERAVRENVELEMRIQGPFERALISF